MTAARLFLSAWLALVAGAAAAAESSNPFENDEAAIRIGAALFAGRCADCHGPDARGNRGPDLTQRWARGETDESAFRVIRAGVGRFMCRRTLFSPVFSAPSIQA